MKGYLDMELVAGTKPNVGIEKLLSLLVFAM